MFFLAVNSILTVRDMIFLNRLLAIRTFIILMLNPMSNTHTCSIASLRSMATKLEWGLVQMAIVNFIIHCLHLSNSHWFSSYLVDPASSHMLVSKIKPCMSKYKQLYTVKLRTAHYISYYLFDGTLLHGYP